MQITPDIISKQVKYQVLNELFAETLGDLIQEKIKVKSDEELDVEKFLTHLLPADVLVSNENYKHEKKDFMVVDSDGEVFLYISPDGQLINNKDQEYYVRDQEAMRELLRLYDCVSNVNRVFTLTLDD